MAAPRSTFLAFFLILVLASIQPATVGAQPPVFVTQWGSYGSGDGQFSGLWGIATDAAGFVYAADTWNNRIQRFTSDGLYVSQWPCSPFAVGTDGSGNVYVVGGLYSVEKFTNTGTYITGWGAYGNGNGQFAFPYGVATDAAGNVYVADQINSRVQKFTGTGAYLSQWGLSSSPSALAIDPAGNVFVAAGNRIYKFTGDGVLLTQWGEYGSGDGQFGNVFGLAADALGNVYVVDTTNRRVEKFSNDGAYLTQWGQYGPGGHGSFLNPVGVATDAAGNIYVSDSGTISGTIQKFATPVPPIAISFDVTPNTLNLTSSGLWITGFLEPPAPHAASDIDVSSIRLNETVRVDPAAPTALGDHDGNGVADLMVKFNRLAVELTMTEGDNVAINVTGKLGSRSFQGTDEIRVRHVPVSSPVAGTNLMAGSVTQVRWQTPSGVRAESAALLHSFDGGVTWSLIARGQPNTGSYDWSVPNIQTQQAKVAVVLAESTDESGELVDGVLGVSEAFSIAGLVGVGDGGPAMFSLRGVSPNPGRGALQAHFSLADRQPARIEVLDVTGRRVMSREVGVFGPGQHHLELHHGLRAGIYVVRLTQGDHVRSVRAVVLD